MNKLILTSIVALSGLLAACTSAIDLDAPRTPSSSTGSLFAHSDHRCDADPARTLVGQTYSNSVEEQARTLSGSRTVRVLRPGQVITMEYDAERINLRLDGQDVVVSAGCG